MDLIEFSREIHRLCSEKKPEAALHYFKSEKKHFEPSDIGKNIFLVTDILGALRDTGSCHTAPDFLQIYKCELNNQTPVRILNSYGWILYKWYKTKYANANQTQQEESLQHSDNTNTDNKNYVYKNLENQILRVLELLMIKADTYSKDLINYLFKLIARTEKNFNNPRWHFLLEICIKINPEMLSTECYTVQTEVRGKQRETELASAREDWYATYSKALYETANYEKCIALCQKAIEENKNLHYRNEVWFKRRMAQCYMALKKPTEALKIYLNITEKLPDWYLLKEQSEAFNLAGNPTEALHWALKAAVTNVPLNFKVELFEYMAQLLTNTNQPEYAAKHYRLSACIRLSEKWHLREELRKKAESANFKLPENEGQLKKLKEELKAELHTYWQKSIQTDQTDKPLRIKGTIKQIYKTDETGISGTVQSENGSIARFGIPACVSIAAKLKQGMRVEYETAQTPKFTKAIKITISK